MTTPEDAPAARASRATRITLLCRGATAANRQARLSAEGSLLPKEPARAAALATNLRPFDRVFCAPEACAAETAAAFSAAPIPCPALRDVDHGSWNGQTADEIAGRFPEALRHWMADPAAAPHGGESFEAAVGRATGWLDGLHGTGGRILAVTHGILLKLVFAHVAGAPLTAVWRIDVEPLGFLDLSSDGRRWALRGFGAGLPAAGHDDGV
ncbi:histidine phosphatase family protein [Shinella sp.]|uniref:histidine phosphatase family protein n=1 Tax=Shinella sp. TaxID=1870904 RepID=UPI0028A6E321|nr:histidine phosphatase family protein [Shinella sp.]